MKLENAQGEPTLLGWLAIFAVIFCIILVIIVFVAGAFGVVIAIFAAILAFAAKIFMAVWNFLT
jgi:hypothetical protein